MPRLLLTDEYWPKLKLMMLEAGIYDKPGLRLTVEGILYRLRVGCPGEFRRNSTTLVIFADGADYETYEP